MKKLWIVALCLILSLTLVACGNTPAPVNPDESGTSTTTVDGNATTGTDGAGATTTTLPEGNVVDGNDLFGTTTTTGTTGTTKKGETTTTTTTTTATQKPTTTIAPPVQEEIKNVKVPAAGYDMDGKKRIIVEKSEVNAKKTVATFTFKNVSKDNGREWIIPEYSKIEYACYDKNGKQIATGTITLGALDYGKSTAREVSLPAGTAELKFTGHNLEYWTPWG